MEEGSTSLRRWLKERTHSDAIGSGETTESGAEDAMLWVSGNGAVGRNREPGKTLFDGGNSTPAVAILMDWV